MVMASKSTKTKSIDQQSLIDAFIDYVLTENEHPSSVYAFAKNLDIKESDFYQFFSGFEALEKHIWTEAANQTIQTLIESKEFANYSAKEKMLGLFFTLVEVLNQNRSYFVYSLKQTKLPLSASEVIKPIIKEFAKQVIQSGIQDKEIEDRKLLTDRYPDALWLNIQFIIGYWMKDDSKGFEKTDALIEKSVNLLMELMGKSAIDNIIDLWKFLIQDKLKHSF